MCAAKDSDFADGICTCNNNNIGGSKCDSCKDGHYHFPDCYECGCHLPGIHELSELIFSK